MEQLQGQEFLYNFLKDLEKAKSLTIISPYINDFAVKKMQQVLINNKGIKKLQFITLPIGIEYVTGSVQPEALLLLKTMGFELKSLKNLHAKLYLIDKSIIYLGSANFTYSGLVKNIEEMHRLVLSTEQYDYIQRRFILPSIPLNINQEIIEHLNSRFSAIKQQYDDIIQLIEDDFESNDYEEFLQKLANKRIIETFEQIDKNYGRNVYKLDQKYVVKILKSKTHDNTAPFAQNFRYSLSTKGGSLALENKVNAFLFILGDTDHFVCIPRTFLEKQFLLRKYLDGSSKAWQFQISFAMDMVFLRTKGRSNMKIFNVSTYKDKIRYKESKKINLLNKRSKLYKELFVNHT